MDRHTQAVHEIAASVRRFHDSKQPYRVFHGSSNSTRPRHGPGENTLNISQLTHITVDAPHQRALVEPNVPMDRLIEATLAHNLIPLVVMEFPGITAGGGFSGTSGESSSFRHGFFNDTVNWIELILGNGDIVRASRHERADLFHGAAGAAGTLGIVTLMELRLVPARKWVKTTYHRVPSTAHAVSEIQAQTANPENDYVDGIIYSPTHSVIITGQLTDTKPAASPARTFSHAADPWFYLHVQTSTSSLRTHSTVTEYIPLPEYLFRYDRAGFWVGRQGYTYFGIIPFTRFFRWLLDDYSHTRTLYHALHASGIAARFVVQDLAVPYAGAEEFVGWVERELGVWPLWLCPLRGSRLPSFHPVTLGAEDENEKEASTGMSQPMLNIGVWGWGPRSHEEFVAKNRALEAHLAELGGRKWLYARTYYSSEEFWREYARERPWYEGLREKYFAMCLPSIYDKVKDEPRVEWKTPRQWGEAWLKTWPIGGIYGMVLATLSGDIGLHRQAKWRYKGE
ncbi:FAD binding domain-containing protein [Rutstroemia sp. NJR-2017a BVV2]|nr:FAD binding domain-containing protein [Rutstroemia sp. NJR-2017a BVV2]